MSKFNQPAVRPPVTSPVATEPTPTGRTFEGAPGFARDAKSELFLLAVANMVGEPTFYEPAQDRDQRFRNLVWHVALADPAWMLGFLGWLRGEANMRSAALVAAAEAVGARLDVAKSSSAGEWHGENRKMIAAVLQRADEPGEMLAYWVSRFGRAIPKPVKRGVADAVLRLYNEYGLLKYDTTSHGYRFGDVIDLVHPATDKPWQAALFRHALDRRHGRGEKVNPEALPMVSFNAWIRDVAVGTPEALLNDQVLKRAGMTWEDVLSLVGSKVDKAKLWEALIPSMGLMALARNLRNFDQAGVSDKAAQYVIDRFSDPQEVAKSRMFPFRWLAAYRYAPSLRWGHALDKALSASLVNVPRLTGRTLILVDVSGSMAESCAGVLSDMARWDVAAVFGAALAMRTDPTLVWFSDGSGQVGVPAGGSLLKLAESIPRANRGTETGGAVRRWYKDHDRVVIITDEQAHWDGGASATASVPAQVPVYTWNLAGYRFGHAPSGTSNRHTFAGLADAAFKMIPLLEGHRSATWPWQGLEGSCQQT